MTRLLLAILLLLSGCDPYPGKLAPSHDPERSLNGANSFGPRPAVYPPRHYFAGEPIPDGTDAYGYNYAEHAFRGVFENRERGSSGFPPATSEAVRLSLRWNDSWLSATDRNGDGLLDRHAGNRNYRGSGAWISVHIEGETVGETWEYVLRAVAVPVNARLVDGVWKENGREIGPALWGCFAVILEFSTRPEGLAYAETFKRRFPGLGLD